MKWKGKVVENNSYLIHDSQVIYPLLSIFKCRKSFMIFSPLQVQEPQRKESLRRPSEVMSEWSFYYSILPSIADCLVPVCLAAVCFVSRCLEYMLALHLSFLKYLLCCCLSCICLSYICLSYVYQGRIQDFCPNF